MKAIFSIKFIALLFFICAWTANSQDMKKPDPINNETVNMILGNWVADPYDMMGSKWNESANHYMKHGQYMFIDLSGSDDKGSTYNGTIVMKLNSDGTFTGWSFDDWGQVGTYTGKTSGNKISVNGKTDWGTDIREIEINGNTMVHNLTMTMKGADGKDMEMKQTITYRKK
ncbi:MAG: hypothetical protein K8I03_11610 [Ignavibacteria bacterium]|nr:hypothetical protein [Ignavibacteria bacterium]